mmetsp:Transcript_60756/g.149414  ORF Transcript_60756/g.149414 Transcript_60756/m.149414 type:complete len:354 (-) Transcript_60756:186-1247(-)
MVRTRKSTPMVAMKESVKVLSEKRVRSDVLPTLESPMRTILNRWSYEPSFALPKSPGLGASDRGASIGAGPAFDVPWEACTGTSSRSWRVAGMTGCSSMLSRVVSYTRERTPAVPHHSFLRTATSSVSGSTATQRTWNLSAVPACGRTIETHTAHGSPLSTMPHEGSTRYLSLAVVRILKAWRLAVLLTTCIISSASTLLDPTVRAGRPSGMKRSCFWATSMRSERFTKLHVMTWSKMAEAGRDCHHSLDPSPCTVVPWVASSACVLRTRSLSGQYAIGSEYSANCAWVRGEIWTRTSTSAPGSMRPPFGEVVYFSRLVVRILKATRCGLLLVRHRILHADMPSSGGMRSIER